MLDRLVSALKPGGLLLIRTRDRYTAAALLDRLLPGPARKALWSRLRPGTPGPFPAVYEKAVCDAGIASYTLMRGLVIAARGTELYAAVAASPAIIVDACHLRRYLPADPGTLRRQPR